MTVRRRVLKELRVILEDDEALLLEPEDPEEAACMKAAANGAQPWTDWEKYQDNGFARQFLVFKPGKEHEAVEWVIRSPSWAQREAIRRVEDQWLKALAYFRCSLKAVCNYVVGEQDEDGDPREVRLAEVDFEEDAILGKVVSKAWLERANLPSGEIMKVGTIAFAMAEGAIPFCKSKSAMPSGPGTSTSIETEVGS